MKPFYIAIQNINTSQKQIIDIDNNGLSGLPCGRYIQFYPNFTPHKSSITDCLNCRKCDGTGGGEEVSGGHKKECEACCGSGLDPVLLKRFEDEDGRWVNVSWPIHKKNCPECRT